MHTFEYNEVRKAFFNHVAGVATGMETNKPEALQL
jgi:hypothetical protein